MSQSPLQEFFVKELVELIRVTRARLVKSLETNDEIRLSERQLKKIDALIWRELKGVLHGFLVILDGGSGLADEGLVSLNDENGLEFDRYLHELIFNNLTTEELKG